MRFTVTACLVSMWLAGAPGGAAAQEPPANPRVVIETSMGDITVELLRRAAPVSVANFLTYVQAGYYDGTVFHRVIRNFMIQGGGLTEDLERKMDGLRGGILNEATNGLENQRGTVAMARTAAPNSASSQFFINVEDNGSLDHRNTTQRGFGYAVFGRVSEGMDVVDDIRGVATHTANDMDDVPRETVLITTIRRVED